MRINQRACSGFNWPFPSVETSNKVNLACIAKEICRPLSSRFSTPGNRQSPFLPSEAIGVRHKEYSSA
jgi:hypothetical protein